MLTFCRILFALSVLTLPGWAGALRLEAGNPAGNPETKGKNAALVARITACQSPEKTMVTAIAEGIVDGSRRSISLQVIPLSTPGTFAVMRGWPDTGSWVVKLVATNPDYKDYAASILVPAEKNSLDWAGVKHFYHLPSSSEVDAALGKQSLALAH